MTHFIWEGFCEGNPLREHLVACNLLCKWNMRMHYMEEACSKKYEESKKQEDIIDEPKNK